MSISQSSNPRVNYYIKNIVAIIISILYATLLSKIPNYVFRDRENYVIYAEYSFDILKDYKPLSVLFNEPLFLYYNIYLSKFFSPDFIPKIGVFFIAFTLCYFILKYSVGFLHAVLGISLLLLVSYTFHLQLVILRQGVATAILLWLVHFFWGRKYFYPLCVFLPFFHSSFFIIVSLIFYNNLLSRYINNEKLKISIIGLTTLLSSFVILKIAENLGVRQASEEHLLVGDSSGGGFVLFSFIFVFIYFRGLKNVYNNRFGNISILGLIVYLSFYFSIPISGRIIGTFLPFMYIYIVSSKNKKIIFAGVVFLIVNAYLFYNSITNSSLTLEGVRYFNKIFFIG